MRYFQIRLHVQLFPLHTSFGILFHAMYPVFKFLFNLYFLIFLTMFSLLYILHHSSCVFYLNYVSVFYFYFFSPILNPFLNFLFLPLFSSLRSSVNFSDSIHIWHIWSKLSYTLFSFLFLGLGNSILHKSIFLRRR